MAEAADQPKSARKAPHGLSAPRISLAIRRRRRSRSPLPGWRGRRRRSVGPFHRISARTRRMATRMASALASSDNRTQVYFDGPVGLCP
uniref:Uncharacterized protein n=1 Tax=Oryza barthii TaxID=65489 RepID=A0A0D3FIU4_9ORYZ